MSYRAGGFEPDSKNYRADFDPISIHTSKKLGSRSVFKEDVLLYFFNFQQSIESAI